jgi:hypothetical protein
MLLAKEKSSVFQFRTILVWPARIRTQQKEWQQTVWQRLERFQFVKKSDCVPVEKEDEDHFFYLVYTDVFDKVKQEILTRFGKW